MTDRMAKALEVVAIGVRQVALAIGFLLALLSMPIPTLGPERDSDRWGWSSNAPSPASVIPEAEAIRIASRNGARVNGVSWSADKTGAAGRYHAIRYVARSLGGRRWLYHVEIDATTGAVVKR